MPFGSPEKSVTCIPQNKINKESAVSEKPKERVDYRFYGKSQLFSELVQGLKEDYRLRGQKRPRTGHLEKFFDNYRVVDIGSAETVLDMGCGTGVATRAIAKYPGFSGKVTGTDLSPYLTKAAASLCMKSSSELHGRWAYPERRFFAESRGMVHARSFTPLGSSGFRMTYRS